MKISVFILLACGLFNFKSSIAAENCDSYIGKSLYLKNFSCIGDEETIFTIHDKSIALGNLGRENEGNLLFDKSDAAEKQNKPRKALEASDFDSFQRQDAVSTLVNMAASSQVVMLNEAHHVSQHRIFALELATALRQKGFTHLAVETLSPMRANAAPYPTLGSPNFGTYTSNPAFAHFLRQAVGMGYTLVPYEFSGEKSIDEREIGQAKNLKAVLDAHPKAKMLVYAGYAHIAENKTAKRNGYMAMHFKALTGIDPFTIDQVGGTHSPYPRLTDRVLQAVTPRLEDKSSVFVKKDGSALTSESYEGVVDVTVFHPATKLVDGRPDWLAKGREKHVVKLSDAGTTRPVALRAMVAGEIKGVPVDQILLDDKSSNTTLFLPKGKYVIEKETLTNGIEKLYDLTL